MMTTATDERDLQRAALGGDRAAWEALIARHQRKVIVALLARGLPIDRAREVAQESWARLYQRHLDGELPELRLPGLAIAQARFLAIDLLRREAHGAPEEAERVDGAATVEERLLGRERLRRAQRELAACSPTAQQIFRLSYEEPELSHGAIAERVGLSLQRVRQSLCETRKRLREAIDGGEADHG